MSTTYRSRSYPFSAGGRLPIDLAFLQAARGRHRAPEVDTMYLRVTAQVAVASGAFAGEDHSRLVGEFKMSDAGGDRVNLRGIELREVAAQELGSGYADPASSPGGSVEYVLPVFISPRRAKRRADFRLALEELLSGGDLSITCPQAQILTNVSITSANYELYAEIVDAGAAEAKSRMTWIGYNAVNAEDYYSVNGALRSAFLIAPAASGASGAASVASLTEIDSVTLGLVDMPRTVLASEYAREGAVSPSDNTVAGKCFTFATPTSDQPMTKLVGAGKVHAKFTTTPPADSRVVVCAVTDRVAANSRAILGRVEKLSTPTPGGKVATSGLGAASAARLPVRGA